MGRVEAEAGPPPPSLSAPLSDPSPTLSEAAARFSRETGRRDGKQPKQPAGAPVHLHPVTLEQGVAIAPALRLLRPPAAAAHHRLLPAAARAPWLLPGLHVGGIWKASDPGAAATAAPLFGSNRPDSLPEEGLYGGGDRRWGERGGGEVEGGEASEAS